MVNSRDGYQWTAAEGLRAGIPSIAVIQPSSNIHAGDDIYDVLVIGAGYSGLSATRDTTTSGLKTLLLEGRDRIGGRTWTSHIDGYPYEMGGTWVHWFQPHVYRELSRYGMKNELEYSPDYSRGHNTFSLTTPRGTKQMSHEEEDVLFSRALQKFVNVDGKMGKAVMPFPYNAYHNKDVLKYAHLSVADRVAQIKDNVTPDEQAAIESFVLLCSGGTTENSSFLDFLRWWAAADYNYLTLLQTIIVFKLKCGQSGFALHFFQEALESGNLSYAFSSAVCHIDQTREIVQVTTRDGRRYSAKRVICTVPLNVLNRVKFTPPLDTAKREAANLGHVNQCVKVHAEVKDRDMRSWSGVTYPHNKLIIGLGDGETPAGNSHIVFFGSDHNHIQPEESIDETLKAVRAFGQTDIERLVFHNWSKDEFAKGAWVWYRPGMEVKYLEALRQRQGSLLFANSDWAAGGWRSFIDGAIQAGTEAAFTVVNELRRMKATQAKL